MKIGIDAQVLLERGGLMKYAQNIIEQLGKIESGDEYYLFFKNMKRQLNFGDNFQLCPCLLYKDAGNFFWEQFHIPLQLKQYNISIFHNMYNYGLPLFKSKKCRYVLSLHDLIPFYFPELYLYDKHFMPVLKSIAFSIGRADYIFTISDFSRQEIISRFKIPENKIRRVYDGYSSCYQPINDSWRVNAFRQKYQLPFPYIIHTGRFDPRKNIVGLLKAFKQFKAESKNDLKLVLPGDFQNLRNFKFFYNPEKIVADLDLTADVIFPGYIHEDDFPLLYNEAVFSIYPSLYEGFGLPIVESMACGTPVITSNCSSMPEVAGEAGILVDPKSIGHMAAAMTELYENSQLREDLSKKGLVQCQKFSWEKAAKDILSVYKEIV